MLEWSLVEQVQYCFTQLKKKKHTHTKKRPVFSVSDAFAGITPMLQLIRRITADPDDSTKCWLIFANQVSSALWACSSFLASADHCCSAAFPFRPRRTSSWGRNWRRWAGTILAKFTSGSHLTNLHKVRRHSSSPNITHLHSHRSLLDCHLEESPLTSPFTLPLCRIAVEISFSQCNCIYKALITLKTLTERPRTWSREKPWAGPGWYLGASCQGPVWAGQRKEILAVCLFSFRFRANIDGLSGRTWIT